MYIFLLCENLEKNMSFWRNERVPELITCHGSSNSRDVAILIKKGVDCTMQKKILDPL